MTTIGQLIDRDLSKKIEEIIKVDQVDEQAVFDEISEYVVTDRIQEHYRGLLKAIAEAPGDPHEGVGVWVSGFFGSGKSSFAKNLGYILTNPKICGTPAAELMKKQLRDHHCADLIDNINARIPTSVVMFDVQTDKAIGGTASSSISRYMYRALLRSLGYAEDFNIAELEHDLESRDKLETFVQLFEQRYGEWKKRRKMAMKLTEASAILHEMGAAASPDSWARTDGAKQVEVTPGFLVEKTFELMARRRPGHACVFIIDEVGAYVARSTERLEDLRRVVELFGAESKTRMKKSQVKAPTWVMVTSQEKLDDVVAALDSKRIELNKLQDRFRYRVDLAPADIREVATRRVLAKTDDGKKQLSALYQAHEGQIGRNLKLQGTHRKTGIDETAFIEFYPYPPHLLGLSIDIMSGIRLQPGAARHLGGSNRTIIKQAYEMLVSERTNLKDAEVGRLVTLDLIFELVEGNLPSEKQKDISDIVESLPGDAWPARVGKAIALLELVRGVPRSEENIAALLHDRVDATPCTKEVSDALVRLEKAQFVRRAEDGFKLQTASEKQWQAERRELDPKPRDRTQLVREALGAVFSDAKLERYQYKQLKQFKVGLTVDAQKVSEGDIPLFVHVVDDAGGLDEIRDETQALTRQKPHENEVHWVTALTPDIDDAVADLFRSKHMEQKYDQLRAQGKITAEQAACLSSEKQETLRLQSRLRDRLGEVLEGGTGFVRGVSKDGSALGKNRTEIFRALFDYACPLLYPNLEMGVTQLKGTEAEELLKATNLGGLPQVFYDGEAGLGLVTQEGGKHVANAAAPVAKEVLDYVRYQASLGEKVAGRDLERRFMGLGYGWDREVVQLALATLLRAGSIEVTYQGRRFRNHQDPLSREPFTKTLAFRGATFSPRESIDLKTLTTAAQFLEDMTGDEADIEEAAIADAFRKLATREVSRVVPARATVSAHRLPVEETLLEYESTLRLIQESASDDCVRMLATEGKSFHEAMKRVREILQALNDEAIASILVARQLVERLGPELEQRKPDAGEMVQQLSDLITSPELYRDVGTIRGLTEAIDVTYGELYSAAHRERDRAYEQAVVAVRGRPEWAELDPDVRDPVLLPLEAHQCGALDRKTAGAACTTCRSTLAQLESELAAADAIRAQVVQRVRELSKPEQPIESVRVAELVDGPVETPEAVDDLVKRLRERLLALVEAGVRIIVE